MDWNMLYSNLTPPTWEQITEYVGSPLWADFNERIQSAYQIKPCMEHSRCSMQAGWNIKYKKSGNGQKGLMLDVRDGETAEDIFSLINLRKRISS